jgi:hypothetical protein
MKDIKVYYGLSGALKGSTIAALKKENSNIQIMDSAIKRWKYYQFGIFSGLTEYTDLTYGILHLVRLREFMDKNHSTENDLIIERGITDSLFYYYYNDEFNVGTGMDENLTLINNATAQEQILLLPDFYKIERILLIQEDKDFVRDVVFQDEFRRKTFKNDPDFYFKMQDLYVSFTKRHNVIDKVIRITSAKEYIENTLGEKLKY